MAMDIITYIEEHFEQLQEEYKQQTNPAPFWDWATQEALDRGYHD